MNALKKQVLSYAAFFLLSFRVPDLISPPLDPPFIERPTEREETEKIKQLETIDDRSAAEEYELGLFYILAGLCCTIQSKQHSRLVGA